MIWEITAFFKNVIAKYHIIFVNLCVCKSLCPFDETSNVLEMMQKVFMVHVL